MSAPKHTVNRAISAGWPLLPGLCRYGPASFGSEYLSQLSLQIPPPHVTALRLLLVGGPGTWPASVRELMADDKVEIVRAETIRQARDPGLLSHVDAVVLCDSVEGDLNLSLGHEPQLLADALIAHRLTAVVLSPGTAGVVPEDDDVFVAVHPETSANELWGRIATIRQYRPLLRRMEGQVAVMQRLGKKLNQQFVEVDQELRLASRLQHDFLPKSFPEIGDIRFAALYRPASWVSGDVYDVRRLDESHIGLYLADAVGHGVSAGLLTMFIRQAIIGKKVANGQYVIVPPDEVLGVLNDQLAQQELPNCQFVTACYATIDTNNGGITFARGGHPHPIHVNAAGICSEVRSVGGLLGIFREEIYSNVRLLLEPGEKLIIYSDGLENSIISLNEGDSAHVCFTDEFVEMARQPAARCLTELAASLDRSEGSLAPLDDQTCLIVERLPAK